MRKIIFTSPDGVLSVIHPVINTYPNIEDLTDEEVLERAKKDIPSDAIDPKIIDESQIPDDRTFRNAWEQNEDKIIHNMDKCREIHKNKLRQHRKPLLESLDIQFMKALEIGSMADMDKIRIKKQNLRDITNHPDINSAQTPEELKMVWPFEDS